MDIYGQPVNFTYQGNLKFQTYIGASLTLLTAMILLSYGSVKLNEVLNQPRENLKIYHEDRNLFSEDEFYDLTDSTFQLAIGSLEKVLPPEIGRYVSNYVTVEYTEDGQRNKTKTELDFIECDS